MSIAAAGGVYVLQGSSGQSSVILAALAFSAAVGGSLFRDYMDASGTQTLHDAVSRIIDFDEVERILYDRDEPVASRQSAAKPLAAIPVEHDPPPALEGDAVARP